MAIGGASQQDTFTDREQVGFGVTTTVPAVGSVISTQPVDFVVNRTDPRAEAGYFQTSDFTVNRIPANSFVLHGSNAGDDLPLHYHT